MANYPNEETIVEALLEAARISVRGQKLSHPEDFAVHMMSAIETTAPLLMYMYEKGYLK